MRRTMKRERVRLLLIEDDEDDYVITRDLLDDVSHVEFLVRWEMTYEGGLAALEEEFFDICLLDYRLGGQDGMSLLRALDARSIGTPIVFLTGQDNRELDLKAMQAGASDYLVKGTVDPPLLERSIRYAIDKQRLLREMHQRSLIDDLTGLFNRRGFEEEASRHLQLASRRNAVSVLLYLDIDGFKTINDRWGHNEGDRALREVADLLRASFRRSDVLARLGGDEFAIVPIDAPPPHHATPEQRLLHNVRKRNAETDRPYTLSLSLGTSIYDPSSPVPLWDLVQDADLQMYATKRSDPQL